VHCYGEPYDYEGRGYCVRWKSYCQHYAKAGYAYREVNHVLVLVGLPISIGIQMIRGPTMSGYYAGTSNAADAFIHYFGNDGEEEKREPRMVACKFKEGRHLITLLFGCPVVESNQRRFPKMVAVTH